LPEELRLANLCRLSRRTGGLSTGGEDSPRDLDDSDVGDAIESVRWPRNLRVHSGRHVREDSELKLGEPACRNAYGVVRAVFDRTCAVIQELD